MLHVRGTVDQGVGDEQVAEDDGVTVVAAMAVQLVVDEVVVEAVVATDRQRSAVAANTDKDLTQLVAVGPRRAVRLAVVSRDATLVAVETGPAFAQI